MTQASTKTLYTSDDNAPTLTQADFERARFRIGVMEINRTDWQLAVCARVGKLRINIMPEPLSSIISTEEFSII